MVPNKFEQHIKKELNKREIQPSSTAWDKIANKLEKPRQKKKANYLWWGIAASFAGLLIISTIYLNDKKSNIEDNTTIVDTKNDGIETKKNKSNILVESPQENQITNTAIDKQDNIKTVDKNTKIKLEKSNNYPQKNEVTEVVMVNPQLEIETNKEDFSQEELIQQKIDEVIAKVDKLEQNDNTLTDAEVDSLILQAQKEILKNQLFRQNNSVDAMALLNEVEDELDKPLKNQLFDLLKKGIFETRNALADRN